MLPADPRHPPPIALPATIRPAPCRDPPPRPMLRTRPRDSRRRARRRLRIVRSRSSWSPSSPVPALFLSGYTLGSPGGVRPRDAGLASEPAFQPFWDTYHTITDRYAGGEVDQATLIQGAIRGMIGALDDPFSAYLTSDEYRQSLQGISGQFEGIGAEIGVAGARRHAGLHAARGDLPPRRHRAARRARRPRRRASASATSSPSVDGASVDGLTVDAARDKIRGPKGTVVDADDRARRRRRRPDSRSPATSSRPRRSTARSSPTARSATSRSPASRDAAADQVVEALRDDLAAGRTKLILDLRGNPGGFVTAARKIASQFIGSGVVFWEQDAQGNQVPTDALTDGVATDPTIQVVVLIDGGSASASEIVAGALQDTKRATLVGQQSYGKGTIQQWQELTGEGGAFKLTIARWLTPDKRWIHGVGLTPGRRR